MTPSSIHRLTILRPIFSIPHFHLPSLQTHSLLLDFVLHSIDIAYGNEKQVQFSWYSREHRPFQK